LAQAWQKRQQEWRSQQERLRQLQQQLDWDENQQQQLRERLDRIAKYDFYACFYNDYHEQQKAIFRSAWRYQQ